jgi:nitrite reductase (NADH) small subunit/3-phenylpropionate/trans-cinnamate dioxygenase ferredoxin subunit
MWQSVARADEIKPGTGKTVELSGRKLAIFNVDGKFHAIDDVCPHRGGPLGEGFLEGKNVTCPWHAWEFDVTSGQCLTMEGTRQKCCRLNDCTTQRLNDHRHGSFRNRWFCT